MIDDEHLIGRHHGDHRRGRNPPHAPPAHTHLQQRGVVRIVIREDPLNRATTATREREADAVGEPVAGDGAWRSEPPALAHCNRHQASVPRYPAMRNSLP